MGNVINGVGAHSGSFYGSSAQEAAGRWDVYTAAYDFNAWAVFGAKEEAATNPTSNPPAPAVPGSWEASTGEALVASQSNIRINYQGDGPLQSISNEPTTQLTLTPLVETGVRLTANVDGAPRTIAYSAADLRAQTLYSTADGGAMLRGKKDGAELWIGGASALSYMRYGYWAANHPGFASPLSIGLFHAGRQTPLSEVPAGGSATYRGRTIGIAQDGPAESRLSGPVTLIANFSTRGISGSMGPFTAEAIRYPFNPLPLTAERIDLSGNISGNSFSGTATPMAGGAIGTGTFVGNFYGPAVAEAGGTWAVAAPTANNFKASGTFGAHR